MGEDAFGHWQRVRELSANPRPLTVPEWELHTGPQRLCWPTWQLAA